MYSLYTVKKHTYAIKYRLLKKYFEAYTIVVSNNFSKLYYIDGFSATGKCKEELSGKEIDGSPLIALKLKFPFTNYIFIEINSKRLSVLEKNINSHRKNVAYVLRKKANISKKIEIETINADINEYIDELLSKIPSNIPTFIFLDPEGLELKWSTVEKCSKKNKVELLINCSVQGIVRNLNIEKSSERIKEFLGQTPQSTKILDLMHQYVNNLKQNFRYVVEKPVKI